MGLNPLADTPSPQDGGEFNAMKRLITATTVSLTLLLVLAGCGQPATRIRSDRGDFMLSLPRIEINIDANGNPSLIGITPQALETLTGGAVRAGDLKLDKGWVDWLVSTNTQHIELLHKDDGVYVWVNAVRMPNVNFDEATLATAGELAAKTGAIEQNVQRDYVDLVRRALPLVRNIGLNVLLRFPTQPGAQPIAARDVNRPIGPAAVQRVDSPSARLKVVVTYDTQGMPSVAGLTAQDVQDIFGIDLAELKLDPAFVARMRAENVRAINMRSQGDGLRMSVDGKPLPALQCDVDCLANTANTLASLNTYPEYQSLNEPLKALAPMLRSVDADITLNFGA
jgi:hypothetical protein